MIRQIGNLQIGKNIFTNPTSNVANTKICKELKKLSTKKTNNPTKKIGHRTKQRAQKKRYKWLKNIFENSLIYLSIRKMKIETTVRFHLATVRMAVFEKTGNRTSRNRNADYTAGGSVE